MKIAVLGGGFSGLTTAYYLAKKNHQVTVFEKEKFFGGLAGGFKSANWNWYLERTIHHLFANDQDILDFCQEIGFRGIFFQEAETASLYSISNIKHQILKKTSKNQKYLFFPLDTPLDLLQFPLLSFFEKLRAGLVLSFFKLTPFLAIYENRTAFDFLNKYMGKNTTDILFKELFRKKFGNFAGNILVSFIWARVKKRTKRLGYVEGGFQRLINYLVNELTSLRVRLLLNCEVKTIVKREKRFLVNGEEFEAIVSTLPTPVLVRLGKRIFPENYLEKLKQIKYLHAVSLVLEMDRPVLNKTYWLNNCVKDIPIMGLFQQTNFIDKKHYGEKEILYCGWYVGFDDKLWKMNEKEILDFVLPYLDEIFDSQFPISKQDSISKQISNFFVFKAPFAQPIFDKEFLKNQPQFITPVKNFYLANLDMTYPYDRGTNYAVKIGRQVSGLI